jgi:hypothetical protein
MQQTVLTLLLYEPCATRRRLYMHHLSRLGIRVIHAEQETHHTALVSMPSDVSGRAKAIAFLERITSAVPAVVLDDRPYDEANFGTLPLQAYVDRTQTSLRTVLGRITELHR